MNPNLRSYLAEMVGTTRSRVGLFLRHFREAGLVCMVQGSLVVDDGRELSVVEYHEQLRQLVGKNLTIPWVFKPVESLAVDANPRRRQAQRVLFEASVVGPLVAATGSRLVNATAR